MIPSALAREVVTALSDFLQTGFRPSNAALDGVLEDFLERQENLVKGPYLSVALPFQRAAEGGEPFPEIPLGFTPFRHQRTAMERLRSEVGRSTVVATGTGSGKTECFLWPVLDHCRREAGKPGIKAILIYPMNALATDQAGRIAATIHRNPALRGRVTAGLFIGEDGKGAPRAAGMGPDRVIAHRETLLEQPPDILLTNYKMLDYLLVRPSDQRLWRRNEPGALRYLVVDELHTFDGAQGTDLACLIRRLRVRLGAGEDLICVGTSATLGEAGQEGKLLDYVSAVFKAGFDPDAIVGESRQGIDEFLGESLITDVLAPHPDLAGVANPARFGSGEDYLRSVAGLFFPTLTPASFDGGEWRCRLAERLPGHTAFVNLLRKLEGRPRALDEMVAELRRSLPVADDNDARLVLNGLCALISAARRREGDGEGARLRPFLRVGLHLWVRELRRMVCSVRPLETADAGPRYALRHSDDLAAEDGALHLPLVQCRECRRTGWGAVRRAAERKLDANLQVFYNRFFARDVDVVFLFPEAPPAGARAEPKTLCDCRWLGAGHGIENCDDCGRPDGLARLFLPETTETFRPRDGKPRRRLSRDCPFCGAREALLIFGARASSLLSVALGQVFASRHNDDRKVIAFSDNVQDAAHRAGFIAARTWPNVLRSAIAQVVAERDGISLAELAGTAGGEGAVAAWWRDPEANPGALDPERFVAEFLAPDRHWLRDFVRLQRDGKLPPDSDLPDLVADRLRWETLAELGHRSTIGRTLERTRAAAVGVDRERLERAAAGAHVRLREEFGSLRGITGETVRALLLGILRRLRERGAIRSDRNERFLGNGASRRWLSAQLALPEFGWGSPRPVFPADGVSGDGLEPLAGGGPRRPWYRGWTERMLARPPLSLALQDAPAVLLEALAALEEAGLVRRIPVGPSRSDTHAWALDPERFFVTPRVAVMSGGASRPLVVPEDEADLWLGLPCLDPGSPDTYDRREPAAPTWYGELYRRGAVRRVVAAEHTALLTREAREDLQRRFAAADPATDPKPGDPNLLSATPTLELGIDIGDLSTVVLASAPPAPENYVQRSGRAGRRDGNALTLAVAAARPHDLYFYAEPLKMLAGRTEPPGVFLNASAVLERQLTAFAFDCWSASGVDERAVPRRLRDVLDAVERGALDRFPYPFFDFVARNATGILEAFSSAFEPDLTSASRDYLSRFLLGDAEEGDSLQYRTTNRLQEVVDERKALKAEIALLGRRIRKLGGGPRDEASDAESEALRRERSGLQSVLRQLNSRPTFNFLTDEGLLPNYAFPEKGVTLKSVIYRDRERSPDEEAAGRDFEHDTYEYVRPAGPALEEFAPENEFYAGGRHVDIDRVDVRVSEIERWRLCRECPYGENVSGGDSHRACPRCGDAMWADAGQLRELLRLRLVHALSSDRRTRIMDERDDREPLFYTRELLTDWDPEAVAGAFAVERPEAVFGFEYVASATFRELNFGRVDDTAQRTKFAGIELPRTGFRICRRCGAVQRRRDEGPRHTRSCPARREDAAANGDTNGKGAGDIADCLYLYREFRSEAIRMLLPVADGGRSDRRTVSFVAALELGLRRRFGGRIDHLRVQNAEYPTADGGPRQGYLVLYDTVPGGTGYLKELMTAPEKLVAVFATAREALAACVCARDPAKDGCHRCVFAYRRSRDMARTSRKTAIEVLDLVLAHAAKLKEIRGLHEVRSHALLESRLEERFIEALRRPPEGGSVPRARVRHDLIRGRPGYVLRVGAHTWYVEPQVELGPADGVRIRCRPDFLIRPAHRTPEAPPVAVFADGFEHHRDLTDDDSAKRMALSRAGYLVWSLTWHDLEQAFGGSADAPDLLGPASGEQPMDAVQQALDGRWDTGGLRSRLGGSSLSLLVAWLGDPDPLRWKRAVFTRLFALFDRERMQDPEFRAAFAAAVEKASPGVVRDRLAELPEPACVAGRGRWIGEEAGPVDLFLTLPLAAVQRREPDAAVAVLHLHDDEASRTGKDYRRSWNGALRAFNLLQFLPGGFWTTRLGMERQRYPEFGAKLEPPSEPDVADAAWREAMEIAATEARPLFRELAAADAPVPEVGFELADDGGTVVAEAEAAWAGAKVALLLPGQEDGAGAFRGAGWRVFGGPDDSAAGIVAVLAEEQ